MRWPRSTSWLVEVAAADSSAMAAAAVLCVAWGGEGREREGCREARASRF
jgi:hypothetical protein